VRIQPGGFVLPPTPPPEVDLDAWERTLAELETRAPERLALIHFGVADDVTPHLEQLRRRLREWSERVRDGASEEEFEAAAAADVADDRRPYEQAMPFWQSYAGLKRYWEKQVEARA